MLYCQQNYKYPKDRGDALKREVMFFKNNKDRMEYKRFRDNGWPIGSSVIGSGVQERREVPIFPKPEVQVTKLKQDHARKLVFFL